MALGQEGHNAMLVDGDLRRPRVTEMLGTPGKDGFVKVLAGESSLTDAVTRQIVHDAAKAGVVVADIGVAGGQEIVVAGVQAVELSVGLADLRRAHEGWMPAYMSGLS